MRPCRQCRAPIENRVAACPRCGASQDDGPKLSADPPPARSRRGFVRELLTGLKDVTGLAPAVGMALLAFPLALGGVVGYLVAGDTGAAVGVTGAIALVLAAVMWAESGG